MGIYSEYLDKGLSSFQQITEERKAQLQKISEIRGRDVLAFVADLNKGYAPISIEYQDLLPLQDQLQNQKGNKLDLILETPGGSGEVAEDIVRLLRQKYKEVSVIVPGYAKSAGTIIAMSADEILMGSISALGPIDAQMQWQGKVFSSDALLEGMEKIKEEVEETNTLNKAYIPILQGISPGDLQAAKNAKNFAIELVKKWLVTYKFKEWHTHSKSSEPVTNEDKEGRATEIAKALSDHNRWLTHGRSLKIQDLRDLKLKIEDYSQNPKLNDAIMRYFVLLQMTFQVNIYKIFETKSSQIYRFINQNVSAPELGNQANSLVIEVKCKKCNNINRVQGGLNKQIKIQVGHIPFPKDNVLRCDKCGQETNIAKLRSNVEAQTKKVII